MLLSHINYHRSSEFTEIISQRRYRIFKEEKRTDKRNRLQKAGTEGRDDFPAPIYPKKVEYTEAYLSKNLLLSRL